MARDQLALIFSERERQSNLITEASFASVMRIVHQ